MTKVLPSPFFTIEHRGDERAGVADDQPSGLQNDPAVELPRAPCDDLGILHGERRRRIVVAIGDAETAAEIDMVDDMAVGAQGPHEIGEQRESVVERLKIDDLRADMHVDAGDRDAGKRPGPRIDLASRGDRHAELVLRLAGGDLGVRAGVDVRIDANGDRGDRPLRDGDRRERLQFGLGLDVEAQDALGKASSISARVLPTPEKTIFSPGTPAARARRNSPSLTTSMPAPSRASVASTAWLELAFIA